MDQNVRSGSVAAEPSVGQAVRRLRQSRCMTLQALAETSGVSVGMLSQIERDRANPSLRVLTQIRQALGVPIGALFEAAAPTRGDPPFLRRAGQRPHLELGYMSKELLSPGPQHGLQFMILNIPAHGSSGEQPLSYPAEKGGLLLEGALELSVGAHTVRLEEGDSFLFDSRLPHGFANREDRSARLLWIIGPVRDEQHV